MSERDPQHVYPTPPVVRQQRGGQGARTRPRRRRWDAGATLTERDVTVLRWIAEQYGVRSDTLRVLLGRHSPGHPRTAGILGHETARQVIDRWSTRGLVTRYRLLGWQWVVPTGQALRLVGLEFPAWTPVTTQLAHVHAVAIVRLAVEPDAPEGGRWVCERELRHDGGTQRTPDAAIELEPPEPADDPPAAGRYGSDPVERLAPRVAVEVELTRKSAARLKEILNRPRHRRYVLTRYYAPPEVSSYLKGQVAQIQPRHQVEIHPLPLVEGISYEGNR